MVVVRLLISATFVTITLYGNVVSFRDNDDDDDDDVLIIITPILTYIFIPLCRVPGVLSGGGWARRDDKKCKTYTDARHCVLR